MYSNYCDYFSFLNLILILYIILYRNERIVNNCNYNYSNNEEYINNFYRSQEAPHQSTWLSRQQSRDRPPGTYACVGKSYDPKLAAKRRRANGSSLGDKSH